MQRRAVSIFALILLSTVGCATPTLRTELYFGLSRSSGPNVSTDEWRSFVDREITPRFPDGLTIVDAAGQWRNDRGAVSREPSKVLILVHPATAEDDAKLQAIRAAYKTQFGQESVLEVDERVHALF